MGASFGNLFNYTQSTGTLFSVVDPNDKNTKLDISTLDPTKPYMIKPSETTDMFLSLTNTCTLMNEVLEYHDLYDNKFIFDTSGVTQVPINIINPVNNNPGNMYMVSTIIDPIPFSKPFKFTVNITNYSTNRSVSTYFGRFAIVENGFNYIPFTSITCYNNNIGYINSTNNGNWQWYDVDGITDINSKFLAINVGRVPYFIVARDNDTISFSTTQGTLFNRNNKENITLPDMTVNNNDLYNREKIKYKVKGSNPEKFLCSEYISNSGGTPGINSSMIKLGDSLSINTSIYTYYFRMM